MTSPSQCKEDGWSERQVLVTKIIFTAVCCAIPIIFIIKEILLK